MLQFSQKTLELIAKACKNKKHIALTVGAIVDGEKMISVFGENGREIENNNEVYEIGSVSKTFNALLMAKLIYENKVTLDDQIGKYVKDLNTFPNYPTIQRLLTHTSGYSGMMPLNRREVIKMFYDMALGRNQDKIPFPQKPEGIEAIIQRTETQDKNYKWKYSNFGFAVIGHTIGIVSGKEYYDAMNEFVMGELGFTNTYLGTDSRNLHGFNAKNEDCGNWKWDDNHYMMPAGALSSTAEDMLSYAKINMCMEKPYLSLCHKKYATISKEYDMGLGWWLHKNNNSTIQHEGGTGAFSTIIVIDIERKLAVVVMANYRLAMPSEKPIALSVLDSLQNH